MKKLNTSTIGLSSSIGFPPKQGTWDFLQFAHQETTAATIQAMIGSAYSANTIYVLWGCTSSASGGNTTIAPGAVFYNGEVFLLPASPPNTFPTPVSPNVIVANMVTTPYGTNADPVQLAGAGAPIVECHNIRTIEFTTGLSGSGMFASQTSGGTATGTVNDYASIIPCNRSFTTNGIVYGLIGGYPTIGSSSFGYKISDYNEVHLSGIISGTTDVGGTGLMTMCTLPYPPLEENSFYAYVAQPGGTSAMQLINIDTGGNVIINVLSAIHNVNVYLYGISYRIR